MERRILRITDKFPFAEVNVNKSKTTIEMRSKKSEIKVNYKQKWHVI